jgi:molybdenum cofactor cytidylyltransferase
MIFGTVPLADAEGAILAHSVAVGSAPVMKKGRRLSRADIEALQHAGRRDVIVARLEPGDVLEDAAAQRIARAVSGTGLRVAEPFTGRANLYARAAGILRFDPAVIAAINGIDEGVTIATLSPNERVDAGQMIATIKIIPFAVGEHAVAAAERVAERGRMSVATFAARKVGIVMTTLAQTKDSVLAKRRQAVETRLAGMAVNDIAVITTRHTSQDVQAALIAHKAAGAQLLLVFAASAIIDRNDVIPAGLVAAGGVIERLGMPVDPGNLLLLGRLGDTPAIGIPSCAASPKLNGFDWVLERVIAGVPISSNDIAAMGVGGLLKEIASRPQPRDGGPALTTSGRIAPGVAVLVLAAGRSTRMGSNKLLEVLGGTPIVRHVVMAAKASSAAEVIVVTGNRGDDVRAALDGLDVRFVDNPAFAAGISTSLRAGIASLSATTDAVVVALGDMPEVHAQHIDRLIAAFSPADNRTIVVPTRHGKRGNPVLWARRYFSEMADVSGDTGAKHLLGLYAEQVADVDLGTDAVLTDIDTPDALAALRARHAT